jgi:formylglycine-generating enzyme required for sulfatase activity
MGPRSRPGRAAVPVSPFEASSPFVADVGDASMTRIRSLVRFGGIGALALGAVAAFAVLPARPQEPVRGKKYALLVAVDRYERGSLLPGLPFPRRDIEGLEKVFLDAGYDKDNVVVMTRERGLEEFDLMPTAEHVRNQLDLLLGRLEPGDSVIVALAGHGVMMLAPPTDDPKGEPRPRSFFCPMDANLANKKLERFLGFDDLYKSLEGCKATVKLLLVDACRNELLAQPEGRPGGIAMPPPPLPPASVAALFSCSDKEVSWEDKDLDGGHGVFFHFVIKGLEGDADKERGNNNQKVELDELYSYVKDNVRAFVARKHAVNQRPRLMGDIGDVALLDVSARLASPSNPRLLTNSIGVKLVLIPAGEFFMGSNDGPAVFYNMHPQHRVRITRPFYLGATEVTRGQFRRFVDDSGYRTDAEKDGKGGIGLNEAGQWVQDPKCTWQNPGFEQTDDHPVVNVSWNDVVAFCEWLSRKEGVMYRLPTEAEWEYACRAGTTTKYSSGDDPEGLAAVENLADGTAKAKYPNWTWTSAAQDGFIYTAPVGRYNPNAWGLFDMHGNVSEWCADGYADDYYKHSPPDDPPGADGAPVRVLRGADWALGPGNAWSAHRGSSAPVHRSSSLGFRLARVQSVR